MTIRLKTYRRSPWQVPYFSQYLGPWRFHGDVCKPKVSDCDGKVSDDHTEIQTFTITCRICQVRNVICRPGKDNWKRRQACQHCRRQGWRQELDIRIEFASGNLDRRRKPTETCWINQELTMSSTWPERLGGKGRRSSELEGIGIHLIRIYGR